MKTACFVTTIDLSLAEKLHQDLIDQGFELSKPVYTVFSAQKKGVSCTLYTSGKLTVQGKDKDAFISFYLEPEILKNFTYSYPEAKEFDPTPRIGIDEAGKGDFFGPLCIAGVQANAEQIKELILLEAQDSKKLNDKVILELSKKIKAKFPHTIIRLYPKKYNELYTKFQNLNHLLAWGHATAIADLHAQTGCQTALIDQFAKGNPVKRALAYKKIEVNVTERTHAEDDPVVAAASILARAAFVEGIELLSKEIGITLPKGASPHVKTAGRQLVSKHGPQILEAYAKLHFKNTQEILS